MKFDLEVKQLILSIVQAKKEKKLQINFRYKASLIPVLKLLRDEGILFKFKSEPLLNRFKIYLRLSNKSIPTGCVKTKKKKIRLNELESIKYKNPSNLIFLNTTKGFIEKKQKDIGGVLFFITV